MTALDRQPPNKNFLSPLGFTFTIKKAPNVAFFLQRINFPSITLPPPSFGNPMTRYPTPGDHIEWGALQVDFKVAEDLSDYLEIYQWLMALGFPEKYKQYADLAKVPLITGQGIRSDISVLVHSSARNPTFEIVYHDAFPTSLTAETFNTTDVDVAYMLATATFTYTSFTVQGINDTEVVFE